MSSIHSDYLYAIDHNPSVGGRVRAFCREDIRVVAALWLKVIYHRETPAPSSLTEYFEEVFFGNPWVDPAFPSLVYEDSDGNIVGFLGVLPRVMLFAGRPIRVAVSTQFFVDKAQHKGPAALVLMKHFLAGPQDLSFTDGATDVVRKMWQILRGQVATLYCCAWTRVLRPAQYILEVTKSRDRSMASLLSSVARIVDSGLVRIPATRCRVPATAVHGEDATDEDLLKCITELSGRLDLRPHYDLDSFRWILRKAAEAKRRGNLEKVLVRDANGEIVGWYVYFDKPDGIAKVVHFGGRDRSITDILNHLFQRAGERGAVAVSGRADPRFLKELSDTRCGFTFHDLAVLMHARDSELANAIHRGSAFLTRLEGEWWLRLHEETWQ